MDLLQEFEREHVKDVSRPRLRSGDIVRVEMKVTESDKTRLQVFEGTIIGIRGSGPSTTFTVRRETGRFGVERIFPLYNPLITKISIMKRQKVRRAKLHYLRQAGRRRVKEDKLSMHRHVQEEEEKMRLVKQTRKKAEEQKEAEQAQKEEEKTVKTKQEDTPERKEAAIKQDAPAKEEEHKKVETKQEDTPEKKEE